MNTTFTGRIARIFDAEQFTTRNNQPFTRRRVLIETVEQYPQRVVVTVSNDLASNFPHQVGDTITAHISFDARPNQDQTAWFNDIRCWRVSPSALGSQWSIPRS